MVEQQILPAAISYCTELAKGNYYCEKAGVVSGIAVKNQRELAALTDEVSDLCEDMKAAHTEAMAIEKMEDCANALYLVAKDKLAALRSKVDLLETKMPKEKWPVPTYSDLLFDL